MVLMRAGYVMRRVFDQPAEPSRAPTSSLVPEPEPLMLLPESALRCPKKRGHAGRPGTGPKGETCGSCGHRVSKFGGRKVYSKCGLNRRNWTGGRGSDVLRKDPACALWASLAAMAEAKAP